MYCNFHDKLFTQFISNKNKIVPKVSDDWEIVNESMNIRESMGLHSPKLNQSIYDISLRRFLEFLKDQNITIQGDKLQGEFVIGQDRSIYTKEMFQEWENKYNKRTETIIPKSQLIPGHKYLSVCGAEILYIGAWYMKNLKLENINGSWPRKEVRIGESKMNVKHLAWGGYSISEFEQNGYVSYKTLTQKITKDLGEEFSKEKVMKVMNEKINNSKWPTYTFFGKNKTDSILSNEYITRQNEKYLEKKC